MWTPYAVISVLLVWCVCLPNELYGASADPSIADDNRNLYNKAKNKEDPKDTEIKGLQKQIEDLKQKCDTKTAELTQKNKDLENELKQQKEKNEKDGKAAKEQHEADQKGIETCNEELGKQKTEYDAKIDELGKKCDLKVGECQKTNDDVISGLNKQIEDLKEDVKTKDASLTECLNDPLMVAVRDAMKAVRPVTGSSGSKAFLVGSTSFYYSIACSDPRVITCGTGTKVKFLEAYLGRQGTGTCANKDPTLPTNCQPKEADIINALTKSCDASLKTCKLKVSEDMFLQPDPCNGIPKNVETIHTCA